MTARLGSIVAGLVHVLAGLWGVLWLLQLLMLGLYGAKFGPIEYGILFASIAVLVGAIAAMREPKATALWAVALGVGVLSAAGILGIAGAVFGWGARSHFGYGYQRGLGLAAFREGSVLQVVAGTAMCLASLVLAVVSLRHSQRRGRSSD